MLLALGRGCQPSSLWDADTPGAFVAEMVESGLRVTITGGGRTVGVPETRVAINW